MAPRTTTHRLPPALQERLRYELEHRSEAALAAALGVTPYALLRAALGRPCYPGTVQKIAQLAALPSDTADDENGGQQP
jgi:hypothetical protein